MIYTGLPDDVRDCITDLMRASDFVGEVRICDPSYASRTAASDKQGAAYVALERAIGRAIMGAAQSSGILLVSSADFGGVA